MKTFIYSLLAIIFLTSKMVFAENTIVSKENRHAVEISIGSIGSGFDLKAYRKLRGLIGQAISNNILDKFVIYGYGIEGGFSGCVEDRPTSAPPSRAFERFVLRLNTIHPKIGTTYSFKRIKTCSTIPAAKTVQVAKSDNSIACDFNSGISLTDMQKQLGNIKIYSAKKLSDGLVRADVCGIETGKFNVYEIEVTNLTKAKDLGFIEWSTIVKP